MSFSKCSNLEAENVILYTSDFAIKEIKEIISDEQNLENKAF